MFVLIFCLIKITYQLFFVAFITLKELYITLQTNVFIFFGEYVSNLIQLLELRWSTHDDNSYSLYRQIKHFHKIQI